MENWTGRIPCCWVITESYILTSRRLKRGNLWQLFVNGKLFLNAEFPQEPLQASLERRKPAWFGNVTRHDSLSETVVLGTVEGGRPRGRQRKRWICIKECTSLPVPDAHEGFLQKRLEEDFFWIVLHVSPTTQPVQARNGPELSPKRCWRAPRSRVGGWGWRGRGKPYLTQHCHHQVDSAFRWAAV